MDIQPGLGPIALIVLFGVFQGILIVYFFLRSSASRIANRNYIFIFLILILLSLESFLNISGYMMYTLFLLNLSTPFIFLIGPLLYSQTIKESGGKPKLFFLHHLPFLLFFAYSFFYYLQPAAYKYDNLVKDYHPNAHFLPFTRSFLSDPLHIRGYVIVELLSLHLIIYALISFLKAKSLKQKDFLYLMIWFTLAGAICILLSEGFVINGVRYLPNPLPPYTPNIFASAFLYCITFYLLGQTFTRIKTEKYSKSKLPAEIQTRNASLIQKVMNEQKPFLDKKFSLTALAELTGISSNHLSQTINETLQTSFFELTNEYRINEAKAILNTDQLTKIEEIGYQVGYNSKSAFYNAFKRQTGSSPASYRDGSSQ